MEKEKEKLASEKGKLESFVGGIQKKLDNKEFVKNAPAEIIEKENVSEIVMGESLNYKGKENFVMKDAKKFAREIKKKFNLNISFEPEFLTTHQAKSIQGENEMTDASAAALILQSFLDKRGKRSFLEEER